jgi:hypothetical protein
MRLAPEHEFKPGGGKGEGKLQTWRRAAPKPLADESDLMAELDKVELRKLLSRFRKAICPYTGDESCVRRASQWEKGGLKDSRWQLKRLLKRKRHWKKADLVELYELAFTNGKHANFRKARFIQQNPKKVARSISFLLEGDGDPYARLEKMLATRGRYKLFGLGRAGATFLMHLMNPKAFAVVNQPVEAALRRLGLAKAIPATIGQWYRGRTQAIRHVAKVTGLKSLARVDHFLDAIGKKHLETGHFKSVKK